MSAPTPADAGRESWADHPLAGLHRSRESYNATADAYEADYWAERMQEKAEADARKGAMQPVSYYVRDGINRIRAAALARQPAPSNGVTVLPDGSACFTASFPLPADHWLYAPRGEWDPVRDENSQCPAPILTHESRSQVTAAVRYAIRGATMCGKERDFDPDALVQNAVYALCGPFGTGQPAPQPVNDTAVLAQHDETGRMWEGMRSQIPPRFKECPPAPQPVALTFTLKEADALLAFFGGEPGEITVRKLSAGAVPDDLSDPVDEVPTPAGLWAHITEYPEEGAVYLGSADDPESTAYAAPQPVAAPADAVVALLRETLEIGAYGIGSTLAERIESALAALAALDGSKT